MLLFYIICIGTFIYVITNIILDKTSKTETIDATLINKRTDSFVDSNNIMFEEYLLIFLIEAREKSFSVSYKTYKSIDIDDKGLLTYKRNKFVSFIKN